MLVDLLIKEQLAKIELPEGQQGPRGLRGRDGNDFNIEDHKEALIQLIESHSNITLTSEQIESLKGADGKDGRDGKSVLIEDVLPELSEELKAKIDSMKEDLKFKFSDFSPEELEALKGADGKDGRDGKDFDFDSHSEEIAKKINEAVSSARDSLKLKFDDLTVEEKLELKGSRGQRGKAGRDFEFEEHRESIAKILTDFCAQKLPELKLKFSDLTEEEILLITGRDGKDGRDGHDFDFEENRIEIQNQICEYIESVKDSLKLYFSDLTDEEKNSLKLKFSDLTEDERAMLKGPRGQRGKAGVDGENGKDAATWKAGTENPDLYNFNPKEDDLYLNTSTCDIFVFKNGEWSKTGNIRGARGIPGPTGLAGKNGIGIDGRDGRDGKDAPYIIDAKLENYLDEEFRLVFTMSDGNKIETNYIDFPAVVQNFYYSTGVSGGGGGSGTANPTQYYEDGVLLGDYEKVNFTGNAVSLVDNGDTVEVQINYTDTNTTELIVKEDGTLVNTTNEINFTGNAVNVVNNSGVAEVQINYTDTNTTELKVERNGTLITTTDEINFTGAGVTVTEVAGKAVVNINGGGGSASIAIEDEGVEVTPTVQRINFVGPYVTVRQRVPIAEWNPLSAVEPNMLDYLGDGSSDVVDVFVDVPDASILRDVDCANDVFVGAFVYIDSSEMARNAKADSYNTSNVIGIVESKTGAKCNIRVSGISAPIFVGLNPELDYFLSDSVAGTLSNTVPTTSGHIKLKLGQSFGSTKFLFQKGERVVRL